MTLDRRKKHTQKDLIEFNLAAAKHNDEMQRQRYEGKYLYQELARLTGKEDGREIMQELERWRRIIDGTLEVCDALKYYRHVPTHAVQKKKQLEQQCQWCGRIRKGAQAAKAFLTKNSKVCEWCKIRHKKGL